MWHNKSHVNCDFDFSCFRFDNSFPAIDRIFLFPCSHCYTVGGAITDHLKEYRIPGQNTGEEAQISEAIAYVSR